MADKGIWRKTLQGLRPADGLAEESYAALPLGAEVAGEFTRPRSLGHHKKFFALLKVIYENQPHGHYKTMDALLNGLKVELGHYYPAVTRGGQAMAIPKSIAFSKMGQDEFEDFWKKAVELVLERYLPGVTSDELEARIMELVS